jgi:nitrate reductase gamma subunit
MRAVTPLLAVLALAFAGWWAAGWHWAQPLFAAVLPYSAVMAFLGGMTWRVLSWGRSPVPFNITTTCGQQYSLSWIRSSRLGNPHTRWGVAGRLVLETLLFRSLLRNVKHEWVDAIAADGRVCGCAASAVGRAVPSAPPTSPDAQQNEVSAASHGALGTARPALPRLVYKASPGLWIGALIFHYSLLVVFLRHARFFLDPAPGWLSGIEWLDSFFRVGSVAFFLSGLSLALAALFLLLRRLWTPWLRYLSLPADFFPLYLLLGIALTGCLMRYSSRVDIESVKGFCTSLARLHPAAPVGLGPLFLVHLTLVSVLFAYLPFSKLAHMASLPLSPTRNLLGASRMAHHENPWNYPVKVHSYEEYEDEYRGKMKAAGIPLEKEAP